MATFKPIAINEEGVVLAYNEGQYIVATKVFSDGTNSYEPGVYVDMLGGRQQLTMRGIQGEQGERGPQGERGLQGVQGIQGVRGPSGTNGRSYEINGQVDSVDQLPTPAATYLGEAWYVGTETPRDVYACVEYNGTLVWENQGKLQGPQGEQGPQGVQGEQGPQGVQGVGLNWKGEWEDGVEVNKNDAFSYNGSSFVAQDNNVEGPPEENDNWGLVAQKGDTGPQGLRGPQGPAGISDLYVHYLGLYYDYGGDAYTPAAAMIISRSSTSFNKNSFVEYLKNNKLSGDTKSLLAAGMSQWGPIVGIGYAQEGYLYINIASSSETNMMQQIPLSYIYSVTDTVVKI